MAQPPNYAMLPQTEKSLEFITNHYNLYTEDRKKKQLPKKPMVIGVSGCQGSGKTTLCHTLVHLLRSAPYDLNVVSFSLDDLYLTRQEQAALTKRYPDNPLLKYRGQFGSHDLALAQKTFQELLSISSSSQKQKEEDSMALIPVYDKSLYDGLGDRCPKKEWQQVHGPIDIILFEGWSLGFKSLSLEQLQQIYQQSLFFMEKKKMFTLTHLAIMNDFLMEYEKHIYPMIDVFLHLSPQQLDQVYQWRLQQEHHMQQTRHVKGLTDDQVRQFVDTYMPAYELYLPQLNEYGFFGFQQQQQQDGEKFDNAKKKISRRQPYCFEGLIRQDGGYSCNQIARHLRLVLDKDRKVLSAQFIHPCLSLISSSSSPFDHQKDG
ncbi:P-loop containing nucleoside triphosphate hydrolase protein [Cunninghamella echinulata]|nr:P-loop containing nucleoside triphosphate hydrolase protein [Cunninghamella echinulata]